MKTRTIKNPAIRRDEILDSARKLIFSKGYEQMTIQNVLDDLDIAKGTIYHYFDSKQALLEALIERIQHETEAPLLPILQDPDRSALEKLQGFFDVLDNLRSANMAGVVKLVRVWYTDDNAIVREKVNAAVSRQRAPLLNQIVRQGIREGIFTTTYPDHCGEIILSLLQGMGNSHIRLLLSVEQGLDEISCIQQIVTTQAAYMDAIEHIIGAASNSLYRITPEAVKVWVTAFKNSA
jgi:AcrR family transcriptional regulator